MRGAPPRPTAAAARPRPCEGPIEARFASRHMIKRGLLPLPTHQPPLTPLRRLTLPTEQGLAQAEKPKPAWSGPSQHRSLHGRGDGEATSIRSSCAPARCRAAATCAPRTSGRPSFMDSGDHGSSATFSRPAWPQAAAVARGARAWLREVVIMSELGLIAPAARHMMHGHHLVHRGWEEHPRTWCFASAPVEASCAAANITTLRSFGAAFSHAHGAVAPPAGLRRAPARNMGSRACREAPGANGHLSIGRPVHLS